MTRGHNKPFLAALAVLVLSGLLATGASAGVGTGGPRPTSTDYHAPVTALKVRDLSLKSFSVHGLSAKVRSDQDAKGILTVTLPDAISISESGSKVQPLASRSLKLSGGKNYSISAELSSIGRELLGSTKPSKLMVTFTAADSNGNQAAPLVKYVTVRS